MIVVHIVILYIYIWLWVPTPWMFKKRTLPSFTPNNHKTIDPFVLIFSVARMFKKNTLPTFTPNNHNDWSFLFFLQEKLQHVTFPWKVRMDTCWFLCSSPKATVRHTLWFLTTHKIWPKWIVFGFLQVWVDMYGWVRLKVWMVI